MGVGATRWGTAPGWMNAGVGIATAATAVAAGAGAAGCWGDCGADAAPVAGARRAACGGLLRGLRFGRTLGGARHRERENRR